MCVCVCVCVWVCLVWFGLEYLFTGDFLSVDCLLVHLFTYLLVVVTENGKRTDGRMDGDAIYGSVCLCVCVFVLVIDDDISTLESLFLFLFVSFSLSLYPSAPFFRSVVDTRYM